MEYMHKMYIFQTDVMHCRRHQLRLQRHETHYLAKCIDKSLMNMHLSTIDLVYIHNAFESWNQDVNKKNS